MFGELFVYYWGVPEITFMANWKLRNQALTSFSEKMELKTMHNGGFHAKNQEFLPK